MFVTFAAGPVPPGLGQLAALRSLDLGDNALSGEWLGFVTKDAPVHIQNESSVCVGVTCLLESKTTVSVFSSESLLRLRKSVSSTVSFPSSFGIVPVL